MGAAISSGPRLLSFNNAYFVFDGLEPLFAPEKEGKKIIYRGTYFDMSGKDSFPIPAVAMYYCSSETYARELQNVGAAMILGVGPKLLESAGARLLPEEGDKRRYPLLIEEDVGISLKSALQGVPIPRFAYESTEERNARSQGSCSGPFLMPADTDAGLRQTSKLRFDLYSQLYNLHQGDKYHRDVRAANVCVKAYGENPEDIRATLIDLEFGVPAQGDGLHVRSELYHRILFDRSSDRGDHAEIMPSPLVQDMGYLSLVLAEIEYRKSVQDWSENEIEAVLTGKNSLFWYEDDGEPRARQLRKSDLERQAECAGLSPVSEMRTISLRAVELAEQITKHGGYLDALDKRQLERNADMLLEKENDRIARQIFENYNAHRIHDGQAVEYPTFDSQPDDLKESCRDQARGIREKMKSFDYDIVPLDECSRDRRVYAFSAQEIEQLAECEHERWVEERERSGWVCGSKKDVAAKISPYMVAWDELEESIKEYDRWPMREMIDVLNVLDLVVCRRF